MLALPFVDRDPYRGQIISQRALLSYNSGEFVYRRPAWEIRDKLAKELSPLYQSGTSYELLADP